MRSYGNVFGKGEEGSEADQTPDLSVENNPEGVQDDGKDKIQI